MKMMTEQRTTLSNGLEMVNASSLPAPLARCTFQPFSLGTDAGPAQWAGVIACPCEHRGEWCSAPAFHAFWVCAAVWCMPPPDWAMGAHASGDVHVRHATIEASQVYGSHKRASLRCCVRSHLTAVCQAALRDDDKRLVTSVVCPHQLLGGKVNFVVGPARCFRDRGWRALLRHRGAGAPPHRPRRTLRTRVGLQRRAWWIYLVVVVLSLKTTQQAALTTHYA